MVVPSPSQLRTLRNVFNDALYRGSFYLLANTVTTSAIGFVFWTLAARRYSAFAVGVFSSVTAGVGLLGAIAALGLPITMTRHIAGAPNPRGLVLAAVAMIATAGTALCLVTIFFLGPHLPSALHIQQHGQMALLVTLLVVLIAVGGTLDAGLVAIRSTRFVLLKNLAGSIAKLVTMLMLVTFGSSGLLTSFGVGLALGTMLSGLALGWRTRKPTKAWSFRIPWQYLSTTSGNYLATVIGIMPLTIVPIEVLAVRGAAETARFSIAFLIAGFLNFIPSTTGQVLFAEIARGGTPLGRQFRKALGTVYALLLPSLALLLAAAPFVLRLFGRAYAIEATGCLRVLALSALPAGGTYLIDSILLARDRTASYTFMQVANAALVLGGVGILLPRGLTAAASGWAIAQGLTLVLGLLLVATRRSGRHHHRTETGPTREAPVYQQQDPQALPVLYPYEWPTRDLFTRRPAGQTAQCSLWFPPIEIPVGFGQLRSAEQLPVLTMVTGYSRWLTAILVPSRRPEDILAGWWELIAGLAAIPHVLTWPDEQVTGSRAAGRTRITAECRDFCRSLGTAFVVGRAGDPAATGLIERAQAYLERTFLPARAFDSPEDFNAQLRDWLARDNMRRHQPLNYAPAELIAADRNAMLPLPPTPPAAGWRLRLQVGNRPFIHFDSNEYSVHPASLGHAVELIANLSKVRVLCDGKVAAEHNRAWTRHRVICDPAHSTAPRYPCR